MPSPRVCSLALVLLAAACGGASRNVVDHRAGGPAPTVAFEQSPGDLGAFTATGLPAIAADGSRVLIAVIGEDGGRGAPNLALVIRDRTDAKVAERVVMTADEAAIEPDGDALMPTPDLAGANAWLAEQHRAAGFSPLAPTAVTGNAEAPIDQTRWTIDVGDVSIAVDRAAGVVVEQGGTRVFDKTLPGWIAPTYPMDDDASSGETCSNPLFVEGAYVDAAHHLALLRVAYLGTDTCWEPDSELHVVAW